MRQLWGFTGAVALGGVVGGCAQLAGLQAYGVGDGPADGGADPGARSDGDPGTVSDPSDSDTASHDAAGADGCGPTCPGSTGGVYSCLVGGCNAAGGACTAAGQGCYCTKDSACKSGKCVKTTGQNDVSCAASCTGAGPTDGFGCALAAPGIPATCAASSFAYTPSNFAPGSFVAPATATTIDCDTTYNSSTHTFTNWCTGQTPPMLYEDFPQAGGPDMDLLAFRGLTLDAGHTLTLTGSRPVILAVYGTATLSGVIDASAHGGTGGAGAAACGVGASGGGAPGTSSGPGNDPGPAGGGGGGLAVAGGAGDYSTYNGAGGNPATGTDNVGAAGGNAHGSSSVAPLMGGCSGGTGADGTPGNAGGTGGVGGGGVQLSVAGTISGTGTIKTNGAAGAPGGSASPAAVHSNGGAGGGGGSGGDILIESAGSNVLVLQASGGAGGPGGTGYGVDTTSANTWPGTPGGSAGTRSGSSTTAPGGGGPPGVRGQSYAGGGGGGGGAYGWIKINTGAAPAFTCSTALAPAPVCNAAHTACTCVADPDCSSGKCVNASGQCTGTCTGSGTADGTGCQTLVSAANAP